MVFSACAPFVLAAGHEPEAQVKIQVPTEPRGPRAQGSADYGDPVFVELTSIAFSPETHQRQHVTTRGRLDVLEHDRYFLLAEGKARVLVLLVQSFSPSDLMRFLGRDADLRGIVRAIRPKQYVGPTGMDLDLIEDPTLPVLPAPRIDWPRVSITLLGLYDRESGGRPGASGLRGVAKDILAEPSLFAGKKARLVGQFRGRNLFGDLPTGSQRDGSDWVLKDGDQALWVSGKEPRGKGWALDPGYRPDTVRWLEVEGKPEVVNGVVYLRASKVRLTKRPEEPPEEDSR